MSALRAEYGIAPKNVDDDLFELLKIPQCLNEIIFKENVISIIEKVVYVSKILKKWLDNKR